MAFCCFRPASDDSDQVLATKLVSSSNQTRSRDASSSPKALSIGPGQPSRAPVGITTTSAAAQSRSGVSAGVPDGAARPRRLLSWSASGGAKAPAAEYRDASEKPEGLLSSLLSRTGSGTGSAGWRSDTGHVSRRKLSPPRPGGSGSDSDNEEDEEDEEDCRPEASGSAAVLRPNWSNRARVQPATPVRGILKKPGDSLDAAAGGDEEALLRIATALATGTPLAAATVATAEAFPSAPLLTVRQRCGNDGLSAAAAAAAAVGSRRGIADAFARGAGAAGGSPLPGSSASLGQVTLDMLGSGRVGVAASAWLDASPAAAAGAAGVNYTNVQFSGGTGAAAAAVSRLATSSSPCWKDGAGGGGTTGDSDVGAPPARIYSVRSTAFVSSAASAIGMTGSTLVQPASRSVSFAVRESTSGLTGDGTADGGGDSGTASRRRSRPSTPPDPLVGRRGGSGRWISLAGAARATATANSEPMPYTDGDGSMQRCGTCPALSESRRRRAQLTAAKREEIMRSLPPGKSPVWYAHKLRELLGTSEVEDLERAEVAESASPVGTRGLREELESSESPGVRADVRGLDGTIGRRFSTRSRSNATSGANATAAVSNGRVTSPGHFQRTGSRLQRSNPPPPQSDPSQPPPSQLQPLVLSVRTLAAASAAAAQTGRQDLDPADPWCHYDSSLPGSMIPSYAGNIPGANVGAMRGRRNEPAMANGGMPSDHCPSYDMAGNAGAAAATSISCREPGRSLLVHRLLRGGLATDSGEGLQGGAPLSEPLVAVVSGYWPASQRSNTGSQLSVRGGLPSRISQGADQQVGAARMPGGPAALSDLPGSSRGTGLTASGTGLGRPARAPGSGGGMKGGSDCPVGLVLGTAPSGPGAGAGRGAGPAADRPEAAAAALGDEGVVDAATASPIQVLQAASRRLVDLLAAYGSAGAMFADDDEDCLSP